MITSEMFEIIGPAAAAALMIALTHAPLGIEVLRRGIIFIDLAVAQIAGLGLLIASMLLHDPNLWQAQIIALCFAIGAALFFRMVERVAPAQQEAIIGVSFVLAASLALLILADHPHGGEEIQHLLSGQMLFVSWQDVLLHSPIYIAIIAIWFICPKVRHGAGFYLFFALAITSSVQLVGVYVVFTSLILPALAVIRSRHQHMTAMSCGICSMLAGLGIAMIVDMPAGPIIVVSYVVITTIFTLLRQSRKSV